MKLKILLPYKIFIESVNVNRIVFETSKGSFGLLPQRLDCVAALVPGIFTYETDDHKINYIAIDQGILIKAGHEVLVSVRNAIGGVDLGKLQETVKKTFLDLEEREQKARMVTAKMESEFIQSLEKFHKE
ncbi:MAG: F0F1 ATP synthase subunit epsilon [Lutibacter sp.]|nr:F0F1 ATP synthase subunit epsilon [Lutibacter sp.]MDT8417774.1 F0F1 ATP synthase subunit epsilon [Lutibacter sp.]